LPVGYLSPNVSPFFLGHYHRELKSPVRLHGGAKIERAGEGYYQAFHVIVVSNVGSPPAQRLRRVLASS